MIFLHVYSAGSECSKGTCKRNAFTTTLETMTKEILVSIQNIVKNNAKEVDMEKESKYEETELLSDEFQQDLLTKHLKGIDSQLEIFDVSKVNELGQESIK